MKKYLYLLGLGIHRLTGWLPFQPKQSGVQFANIAPGVHRDGIVAMIPDVVASSASTASGAESQGHHLLWMISGASDGDHVVLTTGNTSVPLGPSDDAPPGSGVITATGLADKYETTAVVPGAINIQVLGAIKGTVRMVADGSAIVNGSRLMPSAVANCNGMVGLLSSFGTNPCVGIAIIRPDNLGGSATSPSKGDVIEVIPCPPPFGVSA